MTRPIAHAKRKSDLIERFGGGCQRCGYNRCSRALQFHHVDPIKRAARRSIETVAEVEAEPSRFMLLCANCHFETHDEIDREQATYAICETCGERFRTNSFKIKNGDGRFCGHACAQRARARAAADAASIATRLMRFVDKQGDCWIWTGYMASGRTPVIGYTPQSDLPGRKGRPRSARRVAVELFRPELSHHRRLTYNCGHFRCINPDHSIPGVQPAKEA
jgi:hypothetical protein